MQRHHRRPGQLGDPLLPASPPRARSAVRGLLPCSSSCGLPGMFRISGRLSCWSRRTRRPPRSAPCCLAQIVPAGLPVTTGSPNTPSRSSGWKAPDVGAERRSAVIVSGSAPAISRRAPAAADRVGGGLQLADPQRGLTGVVLATLAEDVKYCPASTSCARPPRPQGPGERGGPARPSGTGHRPRTGPGRRATRLPCRTCLLLPL